MRSEPSNIPLDVVVKTEEDIADLTVAKSLLHLPEESSSALSEFKGEMYQICSLHYLHFQLLLEEHKCNFGE